MQFKTFGEWLRHQRLQKEISPFKMAEALGYKRVSAIYNFEYGIAPLPITKWPAMASVLQLSMEEFLRVMEQFSPEKVSEFELIRGTAIPVDGALYGKTSGGDEEQLTVIAPTSVRAGDDDLRAYQLEDAEAVLVTPETGENSLLQALDQLRRQREARLGLLQLTRDVPFPSAAVVSVLKEVKTVCVLDHEDERELPGSLADRLKAAFLDALTGAEGYPDIHRVPKIFSVIVSPSPDEWTAHAIEEIVRHFQKNGRQRHLSVTMERSVSFPIKRR